MPKTGSKNESKVQAPKGAKKVDELTNYLVTESSREVSKPDKAVAAEISLLMAEKGRKGGKKSGKRRFKKR